MTSYFTGGGGAGGACHRCGRAGHLARDCSLQTCFRCNGRGHMAWECADGVTCSKCGGRGHLQRNCKSVACHKCGRKGHISKFCSDPFARAAEMEKIERQQAVQAATAARAKAVQTLSRGNGVVIRRGGSEEFVGKGSSASGPWDNLGRVSSSGGGAGEGVGGCTGNSTAAGPGGRATPITTATVTKEGGENVAVLKKGRDGGGGQQSVLGGRLKVVGLKRKVLELEERGKERDEENERGREGRREGKLDGVAQLRSIDKEGKEGGEPWQGLVEYGSEEEEGGAGEGESEDERKAESIGTENCSSRTEAPTAASPSECRHGDEQETVRCKVFVEGREEGVDVGVREGEAEEEGGVWRRRELEMPVKLLVTGESGES